MARRFKDRVLQACYERALERRPTVGSCGVFSAYLRGLNFPDRRPGYLRTSPAYAWWAAGKDVALGRVR